MCCSVTPGVEVRFSDTVLYAAEALDPSGRNVHVLGYQNKVQGRVGLQSFVRAWLSFARAGNAMILPFPAVPKTMTRANVLDTGDCREILQDIANAIPRRNRSLYFGGPQADLAPPSVQVFEAAGIYTVVLAQDPRDIPAALREVPASKRPTINPALFDAYARWYPRWTVALCCFNNRRARLADPLLWWYEPMFPDQLFLPAVDGHTGDVPDLNAHVAVDHTIAVSSHRMADGRPVQYRNVLPREMRAYLLPRVVGERLSGHMPNGDFVLPLDDVRRGRFTANRMRPAA